MQNDKTEDLALALYNEDQNGSAKYDYKSIREDARKQVESEMGIEQGSNQATGVDCERRLDGS
jgi:hypothetical protein